jgi:hypothetical protein
MMAEAKSGLPVVAYWRLGWPGLRPAMTVAATTVRPRRFGHDGSAMTVTARAVTATTDPAMMDPAMMDKGLLA